MQRLAEDHALAGNESNESCRASVKIWLKCRWPGRLEDVGPSVDSI